MEEIYLISTDGYRDSINLDNFAYDRESLCKLALKEIENYYYGDGYKFNIKHLNYLNGTIEFLVMDEDGIFGNSIKTIHFFTIKRFK